MKIPIPHASADAYRRHQGRASQNPGLIFDRYVPDWGKDGEAKTPGSKEDEPKLVGLKAVVQASEKIDRGLFEQFVDRWRKMAITLGAEVCGMTTQWRLNTGLGRKGSLETGFTFNRYGFPLLPGSSIKGVARSFALYQVAGLLETEQPNELDELLSLERAKFNKEFPAAFPSPSAEAVKKVDQFRRVFGCLDYAGEAIFLDGIPVQAPALVIDIMNPHYPDYYRDPTRQTPATSWQSPVPVHFLTVGPGTRFEFAIAWRRHPADPERKALATDWMVGGLTELGIGAKTSAGYGYFTSAGPGGTAAVTGVSTGAAAPTGELPPPDFSSLQWKPGKMRGKQVADLRQPDQTYPIPKGNILPKGYTPPDRAEVDYAVEQLPGGQTRVWVKQKYYPVK